MNSKVKKEVEKIIQALNLQCSVKEFKDNADWDWISRNVNLSEDFIREFKDQLDWFEISCSNLSLDFIREMQEYIDWDELFASQDLPEDFLEEFKHKL